MKAGISLRVTARLKRKTSTDETGADSTTGTSDPPPDHHKNRPKRKPHRDQRGRGGGKGNHENVTWTPCLDRRLSM